MTRRTSPNPDQPALIAVEQEQPTPTAGDLVAAWCAGYTKVRRIQPHPNVVRRVAGVAKNISKDCTEIDHWRQAWRAAHAAGQQGRWDITCCLIDEQPRSLYPVKGTVSARDAVVARLQRDALPSAIVHEIHQ